ncbi:SDR family oxidoreductase [Paenibacillus xanthanilyticus]|uniref:SDR family oxidoreductase n=1 Tax=Paenibacillus xanthanilyticus TaxID=1783531 RepID=A0ABV8K2F6_9BACL
MIVVTGANGQLGRLVVEQLLLHVPAEQIGISVRDVNKAANLKERGVRVRGGDYNDAASLAHAFDGASQVFMVSSNDLGESTVRQHRTAIEAAVRAGASRIVYTSQMGASPDSYFPPMVDHAATETLLVDSGLAYVSLRNGFYADSALMLLGDALRTGELAAPEDGPVAWTSHGDLAEAAAVALLDGSIGGVTPVLTGSEVMDLEGIAAMAAELLGRPVRRTVIADDAYRAELIARGLPEERADMFAGLYRACRRGEFARTDSTLARLLGRPTAPFRDTLKRAIDRLPRG